MVCVELTENKSRQGRAWYFAALPPLSAPLQALSLATGTPASLIWALRVSSALGVRFDGEKQRGARKKFGSMERLTTVNSAGLGGGVSLFLAPHADFLPPFCFLLILVSSAVYVTAPCTTRETDSLTQVTRAGPLCSRKQALVRSCSLLQRQLRNGLDILESSQFSVGF